MHDAGDRDHEDCNHGTAAQYPRSGPRQSYYCPEHSLGIPEAQGYLGKTAEGDAVYVEIETKSITQGMTVDHEPVTEGVALSISGHWFGKGKRRTGWTGGGQCIDMAGWVVNPAPGLTLEHVVRLVEIWRRWHHNDMRAGCRHVPIPLYQTSQGYQRADLDNTPACPATGYRYGNAWLYEEPPADVIADLRKITLLLDGTTGVRGGGSHE